MSLSGCFGEEEIEVIEETSGFFDFKTCSTIELGIITPVELTP